MARPASQHATERHYEGARPVSEVHKPFASRLELWSRPWPVLALLAALVLVWGVTHVSRGRVERLPCALSPNGAAAEAAAAAAAAQPTDAAAAGAGAGVGAWQPRTCDPPRIDGTPWEHHCKRIKWVCVDQSKLVLYEEKFQEVGGVKAGKLPTLLVDKSKLYKFPWRAAGTAAGGGAAAADANVSREAAAAVEEEEEEQEDGASGDGSSGDSSSDGSSDSSEVRRRRGRKLAYRLQNPAKYRRRLEPIPMRPASSLEGRPYLQSPSFSNCTVPIVVYPIFADNFVHVFHDLASFLHALLRRTPWRRHAKLVVMTPEGLGMTPPEAQLLPALTPSMSVESFADFSRRLPHDYDPAAQALKFDALHPPPSFEGDEQRCFRNLFVCGRRFRAYRPLDDDDDGALQAGAAEPNEEAVAAATAAGGGDDELGSEGDGAELSGTAAVAGLAGVVGEEAGQEAAIRAGLHYEIPREDFSYGQSVVRYVRRRQRLAERQEQGQALGGGGGGGGGDGDASTDGDTSSSDDDADDDPSSSSSDDADGAEAADFTAGRRLKVLIMRRDSGGRQILNAEDLARSCNAWSYQSPDSSSVFTAECRQAQFPTLAAGVEAAREADVFIGIHGANMGNSWMMRPGSSTIEITPYQFSAIPGSFGLSNANAQDPSSRLLWWLAVVCDGGIAEPGPEEAAGVGSQKWWPRDRNVRMPWAALAAILEQGVVGTGGDRRAYLGLYLGGMHRFNVGAAGVLSRGTGGRDPHDACPPVNGTEGWR